MSLSSFTNIMLPAIERELQKVVAWLDKPDTRLFYQMLTYHMGWSGSDHGLEATGKRIRPLLLLLACEACGADWRRSLPAAACVELIHNFSLVHDDIQDRSKLRRGRLTIWKKWGTPQAINVGDALFILAHLISLDIQNEYPPTLVLKVEKSIDKACLALSSGQFLDIHFEKKTTMPIENYWQMVTGKTAALLSACTHIGALLGGGDDTIQEYYRSFGQYLGMAFQAQDDFLGIWGDSVLMGKSTESDLAAGKKTLPVLFGLLKNGSFARRWAKGSIREEEILQISEQLAIEGARSYTLDAVDQMTKLALYSLRAANPHGEAGKALFELANKLLNRKN
jgi:geranylgeranyl diphosphate synthase type I